MKRLVIVLVHYVPVPLGKQYPIGLLVVQNGEAPEPPNTRVEGPATPAGDVAHWHKAGTTKRCIRLPVR